MRINLVESPFRERKQVSEQFGFTTVCKLPNNGALIGRLHEVRKSNTKPSLPALAWSILASFLSQNFVMRQTTMQKT